MPQPVATSDLLLRAREALRSGQLEAAETLCDQFAQLAPAEPAVWQIRGYIELSRGRLSEAEAHLRQAAQLDPLQAQVWSQLAIVLRQQGRPSDAEAAARQALALDEGAASPWARLGECLADQARWPEAAAALRQTLARHPRDAAAWLLLAQAEQRQQHWEAAAEAFTQCLQLAPADEQAVSHYGLFHCQRGRAALARDLLLAFVAQHSQSGGAWHVLGQAHEQCADLQQAEVAQRHALALAPDARAAREARLALARLIHGQSRVIEAEQLVRQLLAENDGDADAWQLLARVQHALSEPEAALQSLQRAVQLAQECDTYLALFLGGQYAGEPQAESLLTMHQRWDAGFARPLAPAEPPRPAPLAPRQRLQLGFVSADFGRHPIGFLTLRALECLDKSRFAIACYSDRRLEDEFTRRFQAAADVWRPAIGLTDEELAAQIRADGIDVLFDLSGFGGRRMLAFARKPAPLQVAWLGYPGTTGMSAMDLLLADRFHVPAGEERHYQEQVLRLPHCYTCYEPPADAPPVGPLPAPAAGYVTFGCLNNPCKFEVRILDAWSAVLRRLPTARLLLKYSWLEELGVQGRLRDRFVARGVKPEQVLMEGPAPHREFLATYHRIDLALDTQPYSGGLTTCEALWMGVPVVTCPGKSFAGRHSLSYLSNVGLTQFIARDLDEYVELAVEWAGRLNELAAIRTSLRGTMQSSPVCDAPRFAQDLGEALLTAWRSATAPILTERR